MSYSQKIVIALLVGLVFWAGLFMLERGAWMEVGASSAPPASIATRWVPGRLRAVAGSALFSATKRAAEALRLAQPVGLATVVAGQAEGTVASVSAASSIPGGPVAPESIVSAYGSRLAITTALAARPLPTQLAGTTVTVNGQRAQLFFVSPGQINYLMPSGIQPGNAQVVVTAADGSVSRGVTAIVPVAPGIFTGNSDGKGVPAGYVLRVTGSGLANEPLLWRDAQNKAFPSMIKPGNGPGEVLYLVLFGTGWRNRRSLSEVRATIGGQPAEVDFAGAQVEFDGLDQLNVKLPREVNGRGRVSMTLSIDGAPASNEVEIEVGAPPPRIDTTIEGAILAGSRLGLDGSGFSRDPKENTVRIGGVEARVVSASTTRLEIQVPYGVQSGPLVIKTPQGEAVSQRPVAVRTSASGFLFNSQGRPLSGIEVSIEIGQTNPLKAITSVEGAFILPDIPARSEGGHFVITFDGTKTGGNIPFPAFSSRIFIDPGQDRHLGQITLTQENGPSLSFSLPPGAISLMREEQQPLSAKNIQNKGVIFEVPRESQLSSPDGTQTLNLSVIEDGRTPFSLPAGLFSSTVAQITSIGSRINPGGRLTFPNRDGYPAGAVVKLYRLDQGRNSPTLGSFVDIGTARVSGDGSRIETGSNAITEATLYLVANPNPATSLVGRVVDSDNKSPIQNARVYTRGQETVTDGEGRFVLQNVPARSADQLTIEATYLRAGGRVDRAQLGGIQPIIGGLTQIGTSLALSPENENRSPVILLPEDLLLNAGGPVEVRFIAFDPDGDAISVPVVTGPGSAFATIRAISNQPGSGLYVLRLQTGSSDGGTFDLQISTTDSNQKSTVQQVNLKVNRVPVAIPQVLTTPQNTPIQITLEGRDPDGDPLRYQIISNPTWGTLSGTLPTLEYRPSTNYIGTDMFSFQVQDGQAESNIATISLSITPVNQAPQLTISGITGPPTVEVGRNVRFTVTGSDNDTTDILTLTAAGLPGSAIFLPPPPANPLSAEFNWTPNFTQTGIHEVTFTVRDNGTPVRIATRTIPITVLNRPPTLSVQTVQTVNIGQVLSFQVSASDPDQGQTLRLTSINPPDGASFTQFTQTGVATGQFSWTPTASQAGTYQVGFRVSDDGTPTQVDTKTVTITVVAANRAPTLTVPTAQTVTAGQGLSFTVTASDPDVGQQLNLTAPTLPTGATFTKVGADTGQFAWTPAAGQSGSFTAVFLVTDNGSPSLSDTKQVVITVVPPNRAPTLTVPPAQTVTAGGTVSFTVTASDPDTGQTLSLSATGKPSGSSFTQTSPTTGQFTWTPTGAQTGSYTVSIQVADSGTPSLSDTRTVVITVNANRAPTLTVPGSQTVTAGGTMSFTVSANDPDTGQTLSLSATGLPSGASFTQMNATTGEFMWTPSATQVGSYTASFRVTDNGNPSMSETKSVEITVIRVDVTEDLLFLDFDNSLRGKAGEMPVTSTGTTYVAGWSNTGVYLPNGSQLYYQSAGNINPLEGTFACWIKPDWNGNDNNTHVIFRYGGSGGIVISKDGANNLKILLNLYGGQSGSEFVVSQNVDSWRSGQWHHIAFTWSNTAKMLRAFVDGVLVDQSAVTGNLPSVLDDRIQIGGDFFGTPVEAVIDELRISGYPRSTQDIRSAIPPNLAPSLMVPGAQTTAAVQELRFTVSANDPDTGQTLRLSATGLPSRASFTQTSPTTGQFTWTPTSAQTGSYTVSFWVEDNGVPSLSDTKAVVITVAAGAPTFTAFNFTTASVNAAGVVTRFAGNTTYQYEEDLGGGVKLEMVLIPGGSFTMGSPSSEQGSSVIERPQRTVTVSQFVMGKYEVTQAQWRAVMGTNPSRFTGDTLPVERVSWNDAQEFCRRLNARLGLSGSNAYRLPTEAEWEYAARAGTTTPFAFGQTINAEIVNYWGSVPYGNAPVGVYRQRTVNVGSLGVANGWGLYDMHGNVWEWVEDDYHDSYHGAPVNGGAWVDVPRGSTRVIRSGGWDGYPVACRSAYRTWSGPGFRDDDSGFRLVRTLP